MFGDYLFRVFHRVGKSQRGVGGLVRIAKVDSQLIGIADVAFTAIAKPLLHQPIVCQLVFVALLSQLQNRLLVELKCDVLLAKLVNLRLVRLLFL